EMSRDPPLFVVHADVMTFDAHGRTIHPSLVGLHMRVAGIEHRAPARLARFDIMREELRWRLADELRDGYAILPRVRLVHDRHPLMIKHIIEQRVLVRAVVPLDGLVQHHDEEPVDRLREEELAEMVGRNGHGGTAAEYPWRCVARQAARGVARRRTNDYANRLRASVSDAVLQRQSPPSYTVCVVTLMLGAARSS